MADLGTMYPPMGRASFPSRFVDTNTFQPFVYNWDAYGTLALAPIPSQWASQETPLPEWGQMYP